VKVFDVIVAGGGPAGATAAKVLGDAGISTLVIDKSEFPRDKPCGGGISVRALRRFPYLGEAISKIPRNWISKVYFESPGGFAVDYHSPEPIYLMIRRCEFDQVLLSLARPRVEIETGLIRKVTVHSEGVTVTADSGEYHARMVIGCDGANSIVARASGLRTGTVQRDYGIDLMEETPREELNTQERDRMHIYYRISSTYGYGYIFPKAAHLNVGIGFKLDHYLAHLRGEHYANHQAFVEEMKRKQLLEGNSNRRNFRAFPLPISGPLARTYRERVLLAGDAGGFVNAITAEGIYYAMASGDLAARAALAAIRAGNFSNAQLGAYEQAWKRELGDELGQSVRLQKMLLRDPTLIDRLVRAASRHAALAQILAHYMTGASTHAQFRRAMLRRALPLYVREKARRLLHG